jgi:hypothetical protein
MRYFLNSKGGIVKYYDSDLALVQTVSKRDLLHGLGVVKEDYETCKLMEGYYAIRYLGGRPTRFWGDTRLTASLIEKTCGISINRIRFASVASRIQEGAALDDIVSLYVEIPAILEEIKEKTVKKLPAPYVCAQYGLNALLKIRIQIPSILSVSSMSCIRILRRKMCLRMCGNIHESMLTARQSTLHPRRNSRNSACRSMYSG